MLAACPKKFIKTLLAMYVQYICTVTAMTSRVSVVSKPLIIYKLMHVQLLLSMVLIVEVKIKFCLWKIHMYTIKSTSAANIKKTSKIAVVIQVQSQHHWAKAAYFKVYNSLGQI